MACVGYAVIWPYGTIGLMMGLYHGHELSWVVEEEKWAPNFTVWQPRCCQDTTEYTTESAS